MSENKLKSYLVWEGEGWYACEFEKPPYGRLVYRQVLANGSFREAQEAAQAIGYELAHWITSTENYEVKLP